MISGSTFDALMRLCTNLYHYRARYYDPKLARFGSSDPAGVEVNPNLYAYVRNRPLTLIDPFGLVDLNLFRPGSQEAWVADQIASIGGEFSVAAHGEYGRATRVVVDDRKVRKFLKPKELAGLVPRKKVRLWVCNAALPKESGKAYAKELAEETQCPVIALTGLIYFKDYRGQGKSRPWAADLVGDASWKQFEP